MPDLTCSVPECHKPAKTRGYCWGHYERYKKLGHPDIGNPLRQRQSNGTSLRQRLYSQIPIGLSDTQCWNWKGSVSSTKRSSRPGYGKLTVDGKQYDAHRISWMVHHKTDVPEGLHVLHRCDNSLCINPTHLWLGTNTQNVDDMVSKHRQTSGMRNARAVLTDNDVHEIRTGQHSVPDLASKFNVTEACVRNVIARRSWRHLP